MKKFLKIITANLIIFSFFSLSLANADTGSTLSGTTINIYTDNNKSIFTEQDINDIVTLEVVACIIGILFYVLIIPLVGKK